MMMNRIANIWKELESDDSFRSGILLRRYSGDIIHDIFVALKFENKQKCLAISLSKEVDISQWNTLKDILFENIPNPRNHNGYLLLLILSDNNHQDIFSILCEDLVTSVNSIIDETVFLQQLLNRFSKWENLFEKIHKGGLSLEHQKGLFGELFFLNTLLDKGINLSKCISLWTGPDGNAKDFQFRNWAVEVKTTTTVNPQKISISNERQLDTTNIPKLFLIHYYFEIINNGQENLNSLVEIIRNKLQINQQALQEFNLLLINAGYFQNHYTEYQNIGFKFKRKTVYQIVESFPKIIENDLLKGVSDVKYSISISACEQFIVLENLLFSTILENANY